MLKKYEWDFTRGCDCGFKETDIKRGVKMEWGFSKRFRDIDNVKQTWGWFFALGLLLIILGSAVIASSYYSTLFSIMLLGIFLCGAGVVQIVQAFLARQWRGLFLLLLVGVLYIGAGVYCIIQPLTTALGLTLWISAFCFVVGICRMLSALLIRFEEWGWVFFNGLVTFLLGAMIYSNWPLSGLWVIGLFIGIEMILSGWSWVILSLGARSRA